MTWFSLQQFWAKHLPAGALQLNSAFQSYEEEGDKVVVHLKASNRPSCLPCKYVVHIRQQAVVDMQSKVRGPVSGALCCTMRCYRARKSLCSYIQGISFCRMVASWQQGFLLAQMEICQQSASRCWVMACRVLPVLLSGGPMGEHNTPFAAILLGVKCES